MYFDTRVAEEEENTDQQAIDLTNDNLHIKINETDIDRSHRIGRCDKAKKKERPIIGKFLGTM